MLLDFIPPSAGTLALHDVPVSNPESRKTVGYVAEQHRIPPHLSGREYLLRHASLMGLTGADAKSESLRVLELVSMTGQEKKKASAYSKGMKQRIGLAAALMGEPKLLILDEPIAGLDPIGIRDVRKIIEHFREQGGTVAPEFPSAFRG